MKIRNAVALLASLAGALSGCGSSSTTNPPQPSTGAVIQDRIGRPLFGEAFIEPFATAEVHQVALAMVLGEADPTKWATFASGLARSLGVYDALDRTCGNQLLAGAQPVAGRYGGLAALLADDRLYLDTRAGNCTRYLGIETGASNDCGGRTPAMDASTVTLSLVVAGTASGVATGVTADPDGSASLTDFPFLRDPTN